MFVQDIITENYIVSAVSLLTFPTLAGLLCSRELSLTLLSPGVACHPLTRPCPRIHYHFPPWQKSISGTSLECRAPERSPADGEAGILCLIVTGECGYGGRSSHPSGLPGDGKEGPTLLPEVSSDCRVHRRCQISRTTCAG